MDYKRPQFFEVQEYARGAKRNVIDLVSGDPDWEPPNALRDGLKQYAAQPSTEFQYAPSTGLTALKEEVSSRRSVPANQIIITNGAGEANYLAMAGALKHATGTDVLLTNPVYPYYAGRVPFLGGTPVFTPVNPDGTLDIEQFERTASEETALIAINNPNNPTGAVYPLETINDLLEIAETYDAYVLCDEVYSHFDYSTTFTSAITLDSPRCIVTSSFSKSLAITGFRIGYGIYPSDLIDAAETRHLLTNVSTTRPAQHAVLHALQNTPPTYYADTRSLLTDRIQLFTSGLDVIGADYTTPDGAFYIMVNFPDFPGTMNNTKRLIDDAGVAGMPGEIFGTARTDWFRFALVTPDVNTATERLTDFFT